MSASMTEHISRRLMNPGGMTQVHKDISEDRYRDLRRPRKVRFFVNGDRFFKGKKLYITPHRYYNFNDLLNDLTGKLPSSINLPYGVRQIFTPVGGRRVSDIEDLQDGATYVCAGFEGFKVIKYGRAELEPWSVGKTVKLGNQEGDAASEASNSTYKYRGYQANAFHPGRYFRTNFPHANGTGPMTMGQTSRRWPGTFGNNTQRNPAGLLGGPTEAVPIKPKVITIVRNGPPPRNNVKILLNRRSVQSYEQLISDISEAFGPKWKNNRVQRLFTTHGKEVLSVSDFFREDDCFIASGTERMSNVEVADILEELFPDSAYAKMLLKDWEKQRRRDKQKALKEAAEGDKKDSGFVDGPEADCHREHDHEDQSTHRSQRTTHRSKRAAAVAMANERDSLVGSESGSPQSYYMLSKLERERKQAADSERDRARKRQTRLADQERKALDEERKHRGLAPLNPLNPLKPLDDIRRKDPKEKEDSRKRKEEEARKKIEEDKEAEKVRREKEERDQAEKAARERMAAADKAEKAEKDKQEQDRKQQEKAEKVERDSKAQEENKEKGEKDNKVKAADQANKVTADKVTADKDQAETQDKDKEGEDKDKENNNKYKHDKERKRKKEKDNGSEKARKAKVKVVRRSKAERQVSSDSFVNERYELGKALGDGNFAIVRTSRQKTSGQEFAMKVIDKPKLKGKEHMVENEIDIMKDCTHPNIVKLYEEYETNDKIYLVMELVKVRLSQ
ncbi:hypothetical protein V1264_008079 [Littorina saxatilis]|uniref:non-specific serine/threonine protein kinase n=1 Tax=Littorina saxatilis TaxID=31220 RepID=A0AAN9ASW3_9CAEN